MRVVILPGEDDNFEEDTIEQEKPTKTIIITVTAGGFAFLVLGNFREIYLFKKLQQHLSTSIASRLLSKLAISGDVFAKHVATTTPKFVSFLFYIFLNFI